VNIIATDADIQKSITEAVIEAGFGVQPVWSRMADDGSLCVEMHHKMWRVLACIERDPKESGWSLVGRHFAPVFGDLGTIREELAAALKSIRSLGLDMSTA
jgi:hypothetical protein